MRILASVTAILVVVVVVVAAAAAATITIHAVGLLNVAQGQAGGGNITLTPAQKAAMCDPNNPSLKFVNTTESHICGLPKSASPNSTTTAQLPTPTTPSPPP